MFESLCLCPAGQAEKTKQIKLMFIIIITHGPGRLHITIGPVCCSVVTGILSSIYHSNIIHTFVQLFLHSSLCVLIELLMIKNIVWAEDVIYVWSDMWTHHRRRHGQVPLVNHLQLHPCHPCHQ